MYIASKKITLCDVSGVVLEDKDIAEFGFGEDAIHTHKRFLNTNIISTASTELSSYKTAVFRDFVRSSTLLFTSVIRELDPDVIPKGVDITSYLQELAYSNITSKVKLYESIINTVIQRLKNFPISLKYNGIINQASISYDLEPTIKDMPYILKLHSEIKAVNYAPLNNNIASYFYREFLAEELWKEFMIEHRHLATPYEHIGTWIEEKNKTIDKYYPKIVFHKSKVSLDDRMINSYKGYMYINPIEHKFVYCVSNDTAIGDKYKGMIAYVSPTFDFIGNPKLEESLRQAILFMLDKTKYDNVDDEEDTANESFKVRYDVEDKYSIYIRFENDSTKIKVTEMNQLEVLKDLEFNRTEEGYTNLVSILFRMKDAAYISQMLQVQ